jgi:hypothetical protein
MTGEVFYGEVPPYSVVVAGTMPGKPMPNGEPGPNLYCAVIVKTRRREDPLQDRHQRTAARLTSRFARALLALLRAGLDVFRHRNHRLAARCPDHAGHAPAGGNGFFY